MLLANKKGQEEMIGFALIVVVVVVAGVIFLGVSLRSEGSKENAGSVDVYHFLESSLQTSTECILREGENHITLGEMISACYADPEQKCIGGESICFELNKSVGSIIEESWNIGEEYNNKGYELAVDYTSRTKTNEENVLEMRKGNCTGSYIGNEYLLRESKTRGTLVTGLKICF